MNALAQPVGFGSPSGVSFFVVLFAVVVAIGIGAIVGRFRRRR